MTETKRRVRPARTSSAVHDALLVDLFLGATPLELQRHSPAPFVLADGRTIDIANPFAVDLEFMLQILRAFTPAEEEILAMLRAEWPRLRPAVLAEWKARKRAGKPPGCTLDGKAKR
jgi:hypothetical protein